MDKIERIRELIESAGSRILSVVYTKADGTRRTMQIQPKALAPRIKGADGSPSHVQGAATRRANHPDLLPVYSLDARGIRFVNLATVESVTVDGKTHRFTAH